MIIWKLWVVNKQFRLNFDRHQNKYISRQTSNKRISFKKKLSVLKVNINFVFVHPPLPFVIQIILFSHLFHLPPWKPTTDNLFQFVWQFDVSLNVYFNRKGIWVIISKNFISLGGNLKMFDFVHKRMGICWTVESKWGAETIFW